MIDLESRMEQPSDIISSFTKTERDLDFKLEFYSTWVSDVIYNYIEENYF